MHVLCRDYAFFKYPSGSKQFEWIWMNSLFSLTVSKTSCATAKMHNMHTHKKKDRKRKLCKQKRSNLNPKLIPAYPMQSINVHFMPLPSWKKSSQKQWNTTRYASHYSLHFSPFSLDLLRKNAEIVWQTNAEICYYSQF